MINDDKAIDIVSGKGTLGVPFLREVIQNTSVPREWIHVLGAMTKISQEPLNTDAELLMYQILNFKGHILLTHMYDGPHSRSPEDMLKEFATQMLERKVDK